MPRISKNGEDALHERVVSMLRGSFLRMGFGAKDMPVFHCPNEGDFSKAQAQKRFRMGVSAGVPDLIIAHPTLCGKVGAALELKVGKNRASAVQKQWLTRFQGMGFATAITTGHEETIDALLSWGYIDQSEAESWRAWARVRGR